MVKKSVFLVWVCSFICLYTKINQNSSEHRYFVHNKNYSRLGSTQFSTLSFSQNRADDHLVDALHITAAIDEPFDLVDPESNASQSRAQQLK